MAGLALNLLLFLVLGAVYFGTLAVAFAGLLRLEQSEESLRRAFFPMHRRLSLPGELLSQRVRLFRVDAKDEQTGLHRVYSVEARHAGAAQMKTRQWGLHVGRIAEQPASQSTTDH